MQKPDHEPGILKGKGLYVRSLLLIIDSIHFCSRNRGVRGNKFQIVRKFMAIIIHRFFALFKFFSFAHGNLSAKREVINAKIFENATLDVGIERFDREVKLRMVCKDLVKRLSFKQGRGNGLGDQEAFGFRKVNTLAGIREMEKVSLVSPEGIVEVMVKATVTDLGTVIASTDRTVTKGTGLLEIGWAIFGAVFARFGARI